MANFKYNEITGVIPALVTPFDENEEFDPIRCKNLVNWLLEQGVNGFYLTGSTGEGFLLSIEERKKVVETVLETVNGRVPVIVHIGAISTKLSIDLAKHAKDHGADAISSVPPFYWKWDQDHIFNYYNDIANAVDLPMIVYNVPLTGLLGFDTIKRLSTIDNVKGIKYTASSHHEIHKIKDQCGKDFIVYSGADEMALSGIFNGADGIVGSFYSELPDLFVKIYNLTLNENYKEAQRLQKMAVSIIDASLKYDYYAAIKTGCKFMGVDAGYVRKPFYNLTNEQIISYKQDLKEIKEAYHENDLLLFKAL